MMKILAVKFPDYYDDLAAFEIESKGYLEDVLVTFEGGVTYRLCFRDAWNADPAHDSTGRNESGTRYLALPNLVVIDTVSRQNIIETIEQLAQTDYFDRLGRIQLGDHDVE